MVPSEGNTSNGRSSCVTMKKPLTSGTMNFIPDARRPVR